MSVHSAAVSSSSPSYSSSSSSDSEGLGDVVGVASALYARLGLRAWRLGETGLACPSPKAWKILGRWMGAGASGGTQSVSHATSAPSAEVTNATISTMTEETSESGPVPPPSSPPFPPNYPPPGAAPIEEDRLGFRHGADGPVVSTAPNPFSQIIQKPVIIDESFATGFDTPPENKGNSYSSSGIGLTSEIVVVPRESEVLGLSSFVTVDGVGGIETEIDFNKAPPGEIIKKGILWKRSRARKFLAKVMGIRNWKERVFILTGARELWVSI